MAESGDAQRELRIAIAKEFARLAGLCIPEDKWVNIDETLRYREAFFAQLESSDVDLVRVHLRRSSFGVVHAICRWLALRFGDTTGVLFHCFDRECGAIRVSLHDVLASFSDVWNIVREDLCFIGDGQGLGLRLEVNYFDENAASVPEGVFDMTLWGMTLDWADDDMAGAAIDKLGVKPNLV